MRHHVASDLRVVDRRDPIELRQCLRVAEFVPHGTFGIKLIEGMDPVGPAGPRGKGSSPDDFVRCAALGRIGVQGHAVRVRQRDHLFPRAEAPRRSGDQDIDEPLLQPHRRLQPQCASHGHVIRHPRRHEDRPPAPQPGVLGHLANTAHEPGHLLAILPTDVQRAFRGGAETDRHPQEVHFDSIHVVPVADVRQDLEDLVPDVPAPVVRGVKHAVRAPRDPSLGMFQRAFGNQERLLFQSPAQVQCRG